MDTAAVEGNRILYDCETEPRATGGTRAAFVHAVEALEQVRQVLFGYADAIVGHLDAYLLAVFPGADGDSRTVAVGQSIVDKVLENGGKERAVAMQRDACGDVNRNREPFRLGYGKV